MDDVIRTHDGKLVLYRRNGIWQARLHLGGNNYLPKSLKTANTEEAKRLGEELWHDTRYEVSKGRVGPVFKPSLAHAAKNSVKIRLADQEGVVQWADRSFGVGEVERDPVVEFHHVEMAEASRRLPTQHLGQEPSGHRLVGHQTIV